MSRFERPDLRPNSLPAPARNPQSAPSSLAFVKEQIRNPQSAIELSPLRRSRFRQPESQPGGDQNPQTQSIERQFQAAGLQLQPPDEGRPHKPAQIATGIDQPHHRSPRPRGAGPSPARA